MQIIKTDAFVLKSFKYGETSKIVALFTKDHGKLNAIVKGVRNYKSRICGTMESMNYISAVIYLKESRDLQLVSNAEYKRSFQGIINDIDKIEIAYNIIELLNKSVVENYVNDRIFELLINVFSKLDTAENNYSNYTLYFLIKLSNILGLSPEFTKVYKEHETFFTLNEFYMNDDIYNEFYVFTQGSLENLEFVVSDHSLISKFIFNYERFVSNHTQGLTKYKSSKVFKQLNSIT